MLKQMRWRFISAAMAAFFAVVLTLLCFVNVWNFQAISAQQDETLTRLREVEQQGGRLLNGRSVPPFDTMGRFSPEVPYMIRFFSVRYDANSQIAWVNQDYIASITQEDAVRYAGAVLESGKTQGYYNGYRYLVAQNAQDTTVLFLNSERELQSARSLLVITVVIAGVCLAVVFLLVLLFSERAIAPYLRNLEAQKQFITNASHELKTPLTAIATSADVLALEHAQDEWVRNIQTQTGRLAKLITNLVTLSRLDEEDPFPLRTEFSLSDALWEVAEPFSALAQARGKQYTQNIADDLRLVGDRAAIGQMVSILLDNALKYSSANGSIALSAARAGKRVQIVVSNTCDPGVQIDSERLFDRFYRADESHSDSISGTGIGLSIAKATVQAHGGSIRAEQRGVCISFCVRL